MEKSGYMKMQKSLRSLLLCVILLCSLLPLSVFAAGSGNLEDIAKITKVEWYEGTGCGKNCR